MARRRDRRGRDAVRAGLRRGHQVRPDQPRRARSSTVPRADLKASVECRRRSSRARPVSPCCCCPRPRSTPSATSPGTTSARSPRRASPSARPTSRGARPEHGRHPDPRRVRHIRDPQGPPHGGEVDRHARPQPGRHDHPLVAALLARHAPDGRRRDRPGRLQPRHRVGVGFLRERVRGGLPPAGRRRRGSSRALNSRRESFRRISYTEVFTQQRQGRRAAGAAPASAAPAGSPTWRSRRSARPTPRSTWGSAPATRPPTPS